MSMKKLLIIFGLLSILLSLPVLSQATPIAINNPGFETDILADSTWQIGITGWQTSGNEGVWNPPASSFSSGIPEGNNVAWLNYSPASISQQLNYFLMPNTQLTLSVDVGWRLDMNEPGYEIQLWAGSNFLDSKSLPSLKYGEFITSMLSYDVTTYFGQPLKIVLLKEEGVQVNFDNVRLEESPIQNNPVPEPSTFFLLGAGLAGVGLLRRRFRK